MITVVHLDERDKVMEVQYGEPYASSLIAAGRLALGDEIRLEAVAMPGERTGWLVLTKSRRKTAFGAECYFVEEPADAVGIIEALAGSDPYQAWYPGSTRTCRHCGSPQPFDGEKPGEHRRDCIWRQAYGWVVRRDARAGVESP